MTTTLAPATLVSFADAVIGEADLFRALTGDASVESILAAGDYDAAAVAESDYALTMAGPVAAVLSVVDPSGGGIGGACGAADFSLRPLADLVEAIGYAYGAPFYHYSPERWGYLPTMINSVERVSAALDDEDNGVLAAVAALASAWAESVDDGDDDPVITVAGVDISYRVAAICFDFCRLATDYVADSSGERLTFSEVVADDDACEHALRALVACGDLLSAARDYANEGPTPD